MKTFFWISYLVNLIITARFLVLYLVNLVIIARPFLRALFLLPIRCVRSISDSWISNPRCSLIMLINKVSVSYFSSSSTPCIRRQFCLEYCFCFPPCSERLLTLSVNSVTCVWSFIISSSLAFRSFSYSSNLSDISCTESVKSNSCFSPLIWLAVVSLEETDISLILDFRFFRQLNKIATQSWEFKLLLKISSGMSLVWPIWL